MKIGRENSRLSKKLENREAKLRVCQAELGVCRAELSRCQKELHKSDQKICELTKSKDKYKADLKITKDELSEVKKGYFGQTSESIKRHKYSELVVKMCAGFVIKRHCSLRTSVGILNDVNDLLDLQIPEIPSYVSVKNWIEKSGYHIYENTTPEGFEDGYAVITDESMVVGSQKLLLTLGVPSSKETDAALTYGDVYVLDMSVQSSWNSESIGGVLETVTKKVGQSPDYGVSDNASTITKAFRIKEVTHHCDVGHTAALCIQHVYEHDEEFKAFTKAVNDVKSREVMRHKIYTSLVKVRRI
ncbi:MAG: hypothetical protein LBQ66_00735 [Planctomycetaceae bacterium]|jgi:hypothetical protein|nr:hypothetical protein [Planctomycetaceae bacterium]